MAPECVNEISTYMSLVNCPITVPLTVLLIIPVDSILISVINSTLRGAYHM